MENKDGHFDYVNWGVRAEYEMLNESVNRTEPQQFRLIHSVYASGTQEAWDKAMSCFPMKFIIDGKVYGRTEMRVAIDY